MSKLVVLNGLMGEKVAFNPHYVKRVVLVNEKMTSKIVEAYGEGHREAKAVVESEARVFFATDSFDEVVSRINAVQD